MWKTCNPFRLLDLRSLICDWNAEAMLGSIVANTVLTGDTITACAVEIVPETSQIPPFLAHGEASGVVGGYGAVS